MYDRDGRRCKRTTNRALRTLHRRATPTEDCGRRTRCAHGRTAVRCVHNGKGRKLETYGKNGHGDDDDDDDAVGDEDDGNGGGNCAGKGVAVDVMGGRPTNLGVAILA